MAAPKDVLLPHSADGIQEYDNPMPAWWLGIFYFTIAFTIVFIPYLWGTGWTQEAQYEAEMAAAAETYRQPDKAVAAAGAEISGDAEAGKATFTSMCVACHGADAKGGIGPDLTDAEWIHGGQLAEIQETIDVGVPAKGMLAWGPVIGDQKVADVAAYVHGLGGGQ